MTVNKLRLILEPEVCRECREPLVQGHFDALHNGWHWVVFYRDCSRGCKMDGLLLYGKREPEGGGGEGINESRASDSAPERSGCVVCVA